MREDRVIDYADSTFEIRPHPKYDDLMKIHEFITGLGYQFPFSNKRYSLLDVQQKLRVDGPKAFLGQIQISEDISPKSHPSTAEKFLAERLTKLGPADDLIIIDPYLFPSSPRQGEEAYSDFLINLILPIVRDGARIRCVGNKSSNPRILELVREGLAERLPGSSFIYCKSENFHDRFWVADESRGVVVGTSLNGLGSKLFFFDSLRESDVRIVLEEFSKLGI